MEVYASVEMAVAQISKCFRVLSLAMAALHCLAAAGVVRRGCATRVRLPGGRRVTVLWRLPIGRGCSRRGLRDEIVAGDRLRCWPGQRRARGG
jgi:hypothetical protein